MHRWRWSKRGVLAAQVPAIGFVLVLLAASPSSTAASASATSRTARLLTPVVSNAVKHDVSPDLRTLRPPSPGQAEAKLSALPRRNVPHGDAMQATTGSAAVQNSVVTNSMPGFGQNFEGVGNLNGVLPPDTQGDVGPNHYVQMINLSFAVYDKRGNLLYGPVPNTTLWRGFGGPCETFNGGDPVTMYDETADRWFMSQLAYPGGSVGYHQCIAISQTPDPTGAWYRYDFLFSSNTLNDYPKFGVWPDAYYASANEFLGFESFTGVTVQAYERDKMLAGQAARVVSFHIGDSSGVYGSLLPSDAEGGALGFNPPAGAPNPFVMFDDDKWGFSPTDRIMMWDFHVDWNNLAQSTFGNNGQPNRFVDTAPFDSDLCNYARNCIPQPATSAKLDSLGDRLMNRAAYRNFGDHQGIALTHTVDVDGSDHAGIRWYELGDSGSGWSLADQGTYAPDSDNRWIGSAALDASGDLAVGFSVSSSSTFPSIRAAGRLAGDPAGQLSQGESTMIVGAGSQIGPPRWGDYSDLQVDPTDACTFWYTTEYLVATTPADWHTRIGSFKFPSCTAGPHGVVTGTVTDAGSNQPIAGATVATSVASTTTDAQGTYKLTLPVGTYTLTVAAFGYVKKTIPGVDVTDGGTTTVDVALTRKPSVHVTGTVADGSDHGWPLYTRIEIDGRPGGAIYTDPATGHYSVDLPQDDTYSVKFTSTLPGYEVVSDTIAVANEDVTHDVAIPIQPTCTAPGYRFNYGSPVLDEPFSDTTGPPPGWTVVDNLGNGEVWRFDNPGRLQNQTGGQGNFAVLDSERYGFGHSQDSSLVTPVLDLSSTPTPVVRFHNDYWAYPAQVGNVDLSTDGGQSWTNVWHHTGDSVRGPGLQEMPIPQAGGQGAVQLRFHMTTTKFGLWWEVDDVAVQTRTCDPIPGGLVVGTVNDANTGSGINGATVTSGDRPAEKGSTAATPNDPNLDDGYYWLFSSLTGSHAFTATKPPYAADTQTVNVAADAATRADFSLKAARLSIDPQSVANTQVLGSTTTATVRISNTGTAPADLDVFERRGAFQILTLQGSPLRLVHGEEDDEFTPGRLGGLEVDEQAGVDAGPPRDPTWSSIARYPSNIMDNGVAFSDGKVYSVGGVNGEGSMVSNAYVYDPAANAWSPIASMTMPREEPSLAAVDGKLYVTGGWDTSGNPIARTDVYDPASNSWQTVSPNPRPTVAPGVAVVNGTIYLVGGCTNGYCATTGSVLTYDPPTDTWSTGTPYPHADAWEACGGINGKLYCAGGTDGNVGYKDAFAYDPAIDAWSDAGEIPNMPIDLWGSAYGAPNGLLVLSSGVTNGFSTVTNQGVVYDPTANSWSALPNAQFPRYRSGGSCGFYKIGGSSGGFSPTAEAEQLSELDQCGVTDVLWLDETPTSATLQPGQSVTVTVTFSATTAAHVTQPGTYTAQLGVKANTPYKVDPINLTLTVTPPSGWGKIAGTVTGIDCKGNSAPLRGVQVQANGRSYTFSLSTDAAGKYAFWAPSASNPFTLIASKDGWIAQTKTVSLKASKTTTVSFTLNQTGC